MGSMSGKKETIAEQRPRRSWLLAVVLVAVTSCGGGSEGGVDTMPEPVAETSSAATTETSVASTSAVASAEPSDPFDLSTFGGRIAIQGLKCAEEVDMAGIEAQLDGTEDLDQIMSVIGGFTDLNVVMQICVMDPDGSNLTVVSDASTEAESPGWSYDGSTLMFRSDFTWFVTDASGSNIRPWDDPTRLLWRMSPDDTQYVNQSVHEMPVYVTPVGEEREGPGRRAVIDDDYCCSTFRWSPDGKFLLFYKGLDTCSSLWKVEVATRLQTPLTGPGSPNEGSGFCAEFDSARWSPDGSTILVMDYEGLGPDSRPYLIDPDGSNFRPVLAEDPFDDPEWMAGAAVWSPDGRAVLMNIISVPGMVKQAPTLFVVPVAAPRLIPVPFPMTAVVVDLAWAPDAPTLNPLPDEDMDAV